MTQECRVEQGIPWDAAICAMVSPCCSRSGHSATMAARLAGSIGEVNVPAAVRGARLASARYCLRVARSGRLTPSSMRR